MMIQQNVHVDMELVKIEGFASSVCWSCQDAVTSVEVCPQWGCYLLAALDNHNIDFVLGVDNETTSDDC